MELIYPFGPFANKTTLEAAAEYTGTLHWVPHLLRMGAKMPARGKYNTLDCVCEYVETVRSAGGFAAYEHRRIVALFEAHHIALPLLPSADVFRRLLSFLDSEPFPDPAAVFDASGSTGSDDEESEEFDSDGDSE